MWMRSDCSRGSMRWVTLVSGRSSVTKTIVPEAGSACLSRHHDTTSSLRWIGAYRGTRVCSQHRMRQVCRKDQRERCHRRCNHSHRENRSHRRPLRLGYHHSRRDHGQDHRVDRTSPRPGNRDQNAIRDVRYPNHQGHPNLGDRRHTQRYNPFAGIPEREDHHLQAMSASRSPAPTVAHHR